MLMNYTAKKGFTLVELLIVIAIVAILATATIVVLNPAELLAQARDAQRIADLGNLRTALGLYVISVPPGATHNMCVGGTVAGGGCHAGGVCTAGTTAIISPFAADAPCGAVENTVPAARAINGTGWIDVDFMLVPGGTPIASLPLDPINVAPHFYAYRADNLAKTFKLGTRLESARYRGMMTTDGGTENTCGTTWVDTTCFYEVGTNLAL